jgi:hypothetical protein
MNLKGGLQRGGISGGGRGKERALRGEEIKSILHVYV